MKGRIYMSKQIKVCLINPPYQPPIGQSVTIGQPLGIAYIAAMLRKKGHEIEILDAILNGWDEEKVADYILQKNPDMIGITLCQGAIISTKKIVETLRQKGFTSLISVGGITATNIYDKLLTEIPEIDVVFMGEGEYSVSSLADCLAQKVPWNDITGIAYKKNEEIKCNPLNCMIEELDELPYPADDYYDIAIDKYKIDESAILTSRGCYGNCKFCGVPNYFRKFEGHKWRRRDADQVVQEIQHMKEKWKLNIINFNGDNFFGPGKSGQSFANDFYDKVKEKNIDIQFKIMARANDITEPMFRKLKEIGLLNVFIGVESINMRTLKFYNKGITIEQITDALELLNFLDIDYVIGYILFDPYVTFDEIKESIAFLRKVIPYKNNKTKNINEYVNVPFGSKLEEELRVDGLLFADNIYIGYQITYYFANKEVQVLSDVFYKLWTERIIPKLQYSWVNDDLAKKSILFKLSVIERLIEMIQLNTLEQELDDYLEKDMMPKLDQLSEKILDAYINTLREKAK